MTHELEIHRTIFETIENLIMVIDRSGRVVIMNPAAERILGYSAAEAVGRNFWEVFIPEDQVAAARERLARILAGTWPRQYVREWLARDGTRRQIRWTYGVVKSPDGEIRQVVGTGTDVTDSHRAEGALRDQTRLLRSVLDSVGDGVAAVDGSGNFLIYTPEAERIMGVPQPTSPREQWPRYFGFYHSDGTTPVTADELPMSRAMRGEECNEVEMQIRRPDLPEARWCSVNSRPLRDESGRIWGGVIASRDISERKRSESEILFRKSLLEAQMESSIDGILVVDFHGKILLSNRRFAAMWEIPDTIVRKGLDDEAIASVLDRVANAGEFVARIKWLYDHPEQHSHDEIQLKDGRTIDRYSAPVRASAGDSSEAVHYGRVWIFRDITDLKHAEAIARQGAEIARENAAHFREMAEHTRRLAREIDHRVGNNLAALLGLVAATRKRAPSVDALADAIKSRVLAMAQVHQLLRQGNWKRVSLAELISSARVAVEQLPHGNVDLIVAGPDVWIEPPQVSPLTMVIVELLTNSAKHGVCGAACGRLSLTWQIMPAAPESGAGSRVRICWIERGGPPIDHPIVPSLGTELVEGFITRELLGSCELRYPREGADHIIEIPLSAAADINFTPARSTAGE
jgi:PAS domain S-box-containing protein